MLTPDQLRRAIQQARPRCGTPTDASVRALCDLLEMVLPDLVTLASGRTEDAGRRYRDTGRRYRDAVPVSDGPIAYTGALDPCKACGAWKWRAAWNGGEMTHLVCCECNATYPVLIGRD